MKKRKKKKNHVPVRYPTLPHATHRRPMYQSCIHQGTLPCAIAGSVRGLQKDHVVGLGTCEWAAVSRCFLAVMRACVRAFVNEGGGGREICIGITYLSAYQGTSVPHSLDNTELERELGSRRTDNNGHLSLARGL